MSKNNKAFGGEILRVISGSARGKKLLCAEGRDIRPTLDRVKESIFNMIAFDIPDSDVLDLFSGSGALGIEALSRGAKSALFVDNSSSSLEITKKNLEMTHLLDKATLVKQDALDFLKNTTHKFDIIFLDPPYESSIYEDIIHEISQRGILKPSGILVIEADNVLTPPFSCEPFKVHRDKKYGRVKILIMKE